MTVRYRLKGASGPVLNQTVPVSGTLLIGSDERCDLLLAEPGVAPRHAELLLTETGEVRIRNLDPGFQTRVNGAEIVEAPVAAGDEIRIAACRWLLQAPGLKPARVLTGAAVQPGRRWWPWWLPVAALLAAWLAWQRGWLAL